MPAAHVPRPASESAWTEVLLADPHAVGDKAAGEADVCGDRTSYDLNNRLHSLVDGSALADGGGEDGGGEGEGCDCGCGVRDGGFDDQVCAQALERMHAILQRMKVMDIESKEMHARRTSHRDRFYA